MDAIVRSSADIDVAASAAQPMYLRPRVKIEPLLCRWPAWPHLIAPATHAMNLAYRHLAHLSSFVATPSVHIAAAADPSMVGGPFVCLQQKDVPRVRKLIQETRDSCAQLIEFAEEFRKLDTKLQDTQTGYGLDELYQTLPSVLKGLVELVYDLNNNPRINVTEEFLPDALSNRHTQEICLHDVADDGRTFFMSTPVLDAPNRLILKAPFDHPLIDDLAAMRLRPASLVELCNKHVDLIEQREQFLQMLTSEAPTRRQPQYTGEGVRIRYFGHACVLLQTAKTSILLDPITAWERNDGPASLTFADLPDHIDYVVITHCHQDHFVPEFLLQLRGRVGKIVVPPNGRGNLADPSMKLIGRSLGYRNVIVLDAFDSIELPEGEIVSLPFSGEHSGLDISSKQCVAITLQGKTALFMVDSDGIDQHSYRYIARRLNRDIEALFLGMECRGAPLSWLYGPLLSKPISRKDDESRRLSGSNCERAWGIVQELRSRRAYVYAMGQEPWMKHIMGLEYTPDSVQLTQSSAFIARCNAAGVEAKRLHGCEEFLL